MGTGLLIYTVQVSADKRPKVLRTLKAKSKETLDRAVLDDTHLPNELGKIPKWWCRKLIKASWLSLGLSNSPPLGVVE